MFSKTISLIVTLTFTSAQHEVLNIKFSWNKDVKELSSLTSLVETTGWKIRPQLLQCQQNLAFSKVIDGFQWLHIFSSCTCNSDVLAVSFYIVNIYTKSA